jgi:hypothetical protein
MINILGLINLLIYQNKSSKEIKKVFKLQTKKQTHIAGSGWVGNLFLWESQIKNNNKNSTCTRIKTFKK